jgi:hypothetical protein
VSFNRFRHVTTSAALFLTALLFAACSTEKMPGDGGSPSSLAEVPSVRLNYRYEADVPAPEATDKAPVEDKNPAVLADFDQNRPQELLDRTLTSPDMKRVLAVYHRPGDAPAEFRLDMYTADGRVLRKVTSDLMAVHFPDTIRWAPDSSAVAFVAMLRGASAEPTPPTDGEPAPEAAVPTPAPDSNANTGGAGENTNAEAPADANTATPTAPTPEAPTGILTFRTEQLYTCSPDGDNTRPITQNEGFIYFYYVWAPDSSMLAALALHAREWAELNRRPDAAGALFVPQGRPRIVERSGRERRLDDALTAAQPVWSPDSSKVAVAYDTQIRIYDALGNSPTQAAIPLRNQLLISSQAYDQAQADTLNADANQQPTANSNINAAAPSTLPDPSKLVSFNPIVALNWTAPELLYFETAYIRRMKNEADNATSFVRWHRLVLTPQAAPAR